MSILQSYRQCLQEPSGTRPEILVHRFAQHLRKLDGPWLVVFDNVENVYAFKELGPEGLQLGDGHGSFLLTTRFPPDYLSIPRSSTGRFKAIDVGMGPEDTSEDYLSQLSELEYDFISCLAFLDVNGIPIELVEECWKQSSLNMGTQDMREWLERSLLVDHNAWGEFRFLKRARPYALHKLQRENKLARAAALAMDALANVYFNLSDKEQQSQHKSWDSYGRHAEAIMQVESAFPYSSPEALAAQARLFHARGTFLLATDMPASAEKALRMSLEIYDNLKLPRSRHHQRAVLSRLATACRAQGLHADAGQLEARFQEGEIRSSGPWKRAKGTSRVDHSNSGAEDQDMDEVEIESVLSNLPSLTAGSTISSALTLALIEDIKADVLTILTKDEELHDLLQETPKRITHDKFQRNFLRLFRAFLSDIRKQSDNGEQELRLVVRVLRYQSRNIASHICQEIFDLKAQSEALLSLAQQVPDKDGQLNSFFGDDRYLSPNATMA
jgi:hypothetical protein